MKRGKLIAVIALLALLSISLISFAVSDSKKIEKISSSVMSGLEKQGKVSVIIQTSNNAEIKGRKIFKNMYAADLTQKEIEELINNPNIEKVSLDEIKYVILQNSTVIVNATNTWKVQISNTNLTGQGQTVCVIDTGINSSHPDLAGKVLGGWNFVSNNNDTSDDYGHGTHVAGIIAANGAIKGVAPDAKLVAIKACNAAGACSNSNITAGINWCVANSSLYNISVISLSLGGGEYDSYCDTDGDEGIFAAPINSAVAKNITVVVASGNYDAVNGYINLTKIASPACIQNATAITATEKDDTIASYAKRNSLVKLAAPGSLINSTNISGSYELMSGTSMATPHVAAAIAILQQTRKLQLNKSYTPDEVVSLLQSKGKQINDSLSGLNYSRINIYASIDTTAPLYYNVTNSTVYKNYFNITWTDDTNVSEVIAEFNGTNYTGNNVSQAGNVFSLNRTFSVGNYTLKWYANDTFGNSNSTDLYNTSVIQANPNLNLTFNASGIIYSQNITVNNNTAINISLTSSGEGTIYLYQDGNLTNQGTSSISNSSVYYVGGYNITAVYNETQNYTASTVTYFITVDAVTVSAPGNNNGGSNGGDDETTDGGGGAVTSAETAYSIVFDRISADEIATISPPSSVTNATSVDKISVTSSIDSANVKFTVSPEENMTVIDDAYKYFSISVSNLEDRYITDAEIVFKVDKSWIEDGNYDEDTVKLNRYHNGKWNVLKTNLTASSSDYYEYSAITPGFSTFAITAEKLPAVLSNITTATGAGANETAKTETKTATRNLILYLVIIAAIAIAIAIAVIILSKPRGHDRFHPKA